MYKNICVLGSTGSIGTQTLQVAEHLGIKVSCIAANGTNTKLIISQAIKFNVDIVAVYDEAAAKKVKKALQNTKIEVLSGNLGVIAAATYNKTDLCVCAIVGNAGLASIFAAVEAGKDIALANKEALVSSGELLKEAVRRKGVALLPVDSEHSAIFQCINQKYDTPIKSIILTASGGPFFGKTRAELEGITPEMALSHPTWHMGGKISIDSASLMNKGLELIEAKLLFDVNENDINIVVHPQSIVHSAVEFSDSTVIAQMGVADMRNPIQYALTFPERLTSLCDRLDLSAIGKLTFFEADKNTFTCLRAAYTALKKGGTSMCAMNSANEVAVRAFLAGEIAFTDIFDIVTNTVDNYVPKFGCDLNEILSEDSEVSKATRELIERLYIR